MNKVWLSRIKRSARRCPVTALLALFTVAALLTPGSLFALHNNPVVGEDGNLCSHCHGTSSLSGAVELNTTYINRSVRTISNMKDALGDPSGPVPNHFGCTFCHSNSANTQMKGVLNHFTVLPTRHPVGETFGGFGVARGASKNEFLTNIDGNTGVPAELECTDCHEISLLDDDGPGVGYYTYHVAPGTGGRSGNPYMLKNVTIAGEYDAFCRSCHNSTNGPNFKGTGVNITVQSHGDGTVALVETDGTPIKTGANANRKCTFCHQSHASSGKKLFVDTMDPSNGTKCVDCHQNGDANNNFEAHGHGMNTSSKGNALNFDCTNCHAVNNAHDPSNSTINGGNPKMLNATEDIATSIYGKSLRSICKNCHDAAQYTAHTGGNVNVGCLDCHDEHAEGSGTGSNRFMIPQNLPNNNGTTELSFFQSAGNTWAPTSFDYWVADGDTRKTADMGAAANAGICDNSVCHGASTPMNAQPLATFLNSANHTGGPITPAELAAGEDCNTCHSHTDTGGSWAASQSCTSCHAQPPVSSVTAAPAYGFSGIGVDEGRSPHAKHADTAAYGYGCSKCHNNWAEHNTDSDGDGSPPPTFQSVVFDAMNPTGSYTGGAFNAGDKTCNNLYCHSNGQSGAAVGNQQWMATPTTPNWATTELGCAACHAAAPTTGSHTTHVSAGAGCQNCHALTALNNTTIILANKTHVNATKDVLAGGSFASASVTFGWTGPNCSDISCHGGTGANALWGGSLSCSSCHLVAADQNDWVYPNGTTARVSSTEWLAAGHGRNSAFPSGNLLANFTGPAADPNGCLFCHDGAVAHGVGTNPFRLRNKNALSADVSAGNAYGWNDACLVCHSSADSDGFNPGAGYTARNGSDVNENHYGSKHTASTKGGTFCWDCHDPHGDVMDYMIHGGNGSAPGLGVTDVTADNYGTPASSRQVTGFLPASAGYTSDDLANASFTGLCQTCHATNATPGRASYYNRDTFTPLASHNGANAAVCTSCHTHTNGFGSACDTCHGNPPLPRPTSGTTQTWVSDNAAGTQGDHTAHNTYGITNCNATCHVVTTHAQNKTSANMGVRAATAAASTGVHKYSTIDNVDVWTGNTAGITSVVDDSCANVNCHNSTYSANAYRSAANPTYVRYWNNTFDCYSCHAYDGQADSTIRPGVQTSVTADWIASGSHDQHINRNGYALACTNCHNTTGYTAARAGAHGDGSVTFVTNYGATRAGAIAVGGAYDVDGVTGGWVPATGVVPSSPPHAYYCGNVYCHSSGEPRGTETSFQIAPYAQWNTPASGNCGTCHTVTGSVLATNVHEKHTGNTAGRYSYICQTCHNSVVNATPAIISFALHVNGTNDVSFLAAETGAAYSRTTGGTAGAAGGTCTATYCHSQGLDWSAPYTQTNNLPVTVADWDIADDGLGCGGCHGNPPSYTNNTSVTPGGVARQKKNSHTAHSGYTCNYCHNTTTTDGVTITTVANHANKVWNIAAGGGATFTPAVGNMAGDAYVITSCATISCHGGAGATWGQTLGCNSCHDTNGATVAENGGVLGGAANGTANEVDNAQWLNTGHGLAAGQYDLDAINAGGGNPAANLGCYTTDVNGGCHVTSAAHVPTTAADPFRLGATYQDNPSGICTASCHSTSATNHHNDDVVANGTTAYNFETKCIDCHDPHGDSNMFMVHNMVAADGPDADNPQAMSSIKGIPDTTKAVTFIADTAGQDFADTATPWVFTGICEVCHDETRWYRGTTTGNLQGPQAGHTYTTNCVTCHKHPSGFKGGGCDGCHGNTGTGQFWPDGVGGVPAYVDNSAGAHQVHIDAIAAARGWTTVAQKNGTCDWCHPNPGNVRQGTYTGSPEAGHDTNSVSDSRVDVIGDGRVTAGDATFYNNANPRVANVGLATYSAATQKCSAIDCHSGVLTPAWAGPAPANAAPSTYNVLANGVVDLVIAQGGTITLTADIDDSGGGTPNNVATAQWKLDATAYAAVDAFTPAASVSVQKTAISTAAWSAGDHFLYVRGSDGTLTGNPAAVKVTVTAADTVTLAATNTAPATVTQGGRVAMLRLNFTVNTTGGGVAVLDRVQLNETGTSLDADIAGVRIYNDGGGTVGTWDATDSLIGSGTLSGGTVTIDIVDQTVTNPATTTLHAIVQASSGGVVGRTVILQVDDAYITLLSPDVMAATATVNSTAATIAAPGGGACQVGAGFLVYPAAFTRSGDSGTSSYMDTTLAANIDCTLDNFCFWNDAGAAPSLINVYTGTWPGTGTTITNTGNETSFTPASGTGWVCTSGSLPILAGEYIGFYETGSVTIARFNTTGGGYIYTAGDQTPPTASWSGTQSTTAYYSFFATGSAAGGAGTIPPLTTNVQANGAASITINQGTTFNLTATVSDSSGGSHTVTQARYQRDTVPSAGAGTAMTATDGSFNSATEAVQALAVSTVGWTAGAHKVYVYGYDATDGWGPTGYATVTIIVPDVMTIALGGSLAPATADKGTTAVMLRFTAGTATGSATVNSFTVDLTGVPPTASDVVRVYLFKENEGNTVFNAAGDLPIGDVLMGSDPQVVPISATVVSTPATSFYVLYDISGSAVGGHTIGATITGAGVTAPDTVAGSAASTLTTINISGSIVCGSCHLNPPAQGAHAKHAATDVITDCDKCHGNATYQPSVAYTTSGPAIHNDGARPEMYFGRITPADNLTYAPPPGTDRCTNADCHNNTLTPPWVGGTTTCSSCHGQGANIPWPNAGAHNAHFTAFNIATLTDAAAPAICDYCHTGYGGGGGGRVGHADNNLYQVAIAATFQDQSGGAMVYGGGAAGTCTNVSCHGGKMAPAWNTDDCPDNGDRLHELPRGRSGRVQQRGFGQARRSRGRAHQPLHHLPRRDSGRRALLQHEPRDLGDDQPDDLQHDEPHNLRRPHADRLLSRPLGQLHERQPDGTVSRKHRRLGSGGDRRLQLLPRLPAGRHRWQHQPPDCQSSWQLRFHRRGVLHCPRQLRHLPRHLGQRGSADGHRVRYAGRQHCRGWGRLRCGDPPQKRYREYERHRV